MFLFIDLGRRSGRDVRSRMSTPFGSYNKRLVSGIMSSFESRPLLGSILATILNSASESCTHICIEAERRRHILHHLENPSVPLRQETRSLNELTGETYSLRSKEEAEDYRYMPDSNLPAMIIDEVGHWSLGNTDRGRCTWENSKPLYLKCHGRQLLDSKDFTEWINGNWRPLWDWTSIMLLV